MTFNDVMLSSDNFKEAMNKPIMKIHSNIQSNLVNLKSSGLKVSFCIISSLNYWKIDIKTYNH